MDRNLTSLLTLGATAAISVTLAVVAPDNAYADDITVDTTTFSADRTRAEVRAELLGRAAVLKTGSGEWALQRDPSPFVRSASTRQQAQAEYKASRAYVSALTAEDSGSSFLVRAVAAPAANPGATLGGPAR